MGMLIYACNPSTLETEAGRLEVQGHLLLPAEFKASLGYIRLCLKMNKIEKVGHIIKKLDMLPLADFEDK